MPERTRTAVPPAVSPVLSRPAHAPALVPREAGPASLLASVVAGRATPNGVLRLQRAMGNRAVGRLLASPQGRLAREPKDEQLPGTPPPGGELTDEEGEAFESVLASMTDDEIDAAFDALEEEAEEGTTDAAPVAVASPEGTASEGGVPSIQRGKSLLAGSNPDLPLANLLEANNSKRPRLVPLKRWRAIKKKHIALGRRKYAAIRHQNLTDNAGKEDLVLLIRLRRTARIGGKRDLHYGAIEAKASKKRQTAQNRTELLGEAVTSIRMEGYSNGNAKLLIGYASGAGIDQLWVDKTAQVYYVVEAKGPGAKLKVDRFAVRGAANGATLTQMSEDWVKDRIPRLATSHNAVLQQLLTDCGLRVGGTGQLQTNPLGVATYELKGLVITARWDETTGELNSGLSKRDYRF